MPLNTPMRRRAANAILLLLLVVVTRPVCGQGLQERTRSETTTARLRAYHQLLSDYRQGGSAPIYALDGWTTETVGDVLQAMGTTLDPVPHWEPWRFRVGAMLHMDVAIKRLATKDVRTAMVHLDAGSLILARGGNDVRVFAGRWYEASGRLLRQYLEFGAERDLLATARKRLPNDARVLYESGVATELLAVAEFRMWNQPPDQIHIAFDRVPQGFSPSVYRDALIRRSRERVESILSDADAYYRAAIKAGSDRPLTWLRLARVLILRNRGSDALPLLERATAASTEDAELRYLAHLLEGSVYEQRGDLSAAIERYQLARRDFPAGQAAQLAAAQALQRAGRNAEAGTLLHGYLTGTGPDANREPWWVYVLDSPKLVRSSIEELTREARLP